MTSLINCISEDLHLSTSYIASVISRSDYYYKDFTIPKKDGSLRKISQASPELKSLQYWVVKNILSLIPVSTSSFAYKTGDSVKRHAAFHKDSYFIFHTDIKKFFPNIKSRLLNEELESHNSLIKNAGFWFEDTCDVISKICFRFDSLCIGSVSSPVISNIVMHGLDENLCAYCHDEGYKYSRYADDIYISSNTYIPKTILDMVTKAFSDSGFSINPKKTWFKSKKNQRRITGLVLTDYGRVSIGYDMRCRIKKMIYDRIVNGEGDPEVILGYLAYLQDIEPAIYNRYLIKYSTYCDGDIMTAIKSGPKPKPNYPIIFKLPDI